MNESEWTDVQVVVDGRLVTGQFALVDNGITVRLGISKIHRTLPAEAKAEEFAYELLRLLAEWRHGPWSVWL